MNVHYFYLVPAYQKSEYVIGNVLVYPDYEPAKAEVIQQIYRHFIDKPNLRYSTSIYRRAVNNNYAQQHMVDVEAYAVSPISNGVLAVQIVMSWKLGKESMTVIPVVTNWKDLVDFEKKTNSSAVMQGMMDWALNNKESKDG